MVTTVTTRLITALLVFTAARGRAVYSYGRAGGGASHTHFTARATSTGQRSRDTSSSSHAARKASGMGVSGGSQWACLNRQSWSIGSLHRLHIGSSSSAGKVYLHSSTR